jgi:hypothetical protein
LWSKDTWSLPIFVLVSTLFFQHCPASNTCCYNSWRMETPFHWWPNNPHLTGPTNCHTHHPSIIDFYLPHEIPIVSP